MSFQTTPISTAKAASLKYFSIIKGTMVPMRAIHQTKEISPIVISKDIFQQSKDKVY